MLGNPERQASKERLGVLWDLPPSEKVWEEQKREMVNLDALLSREEAH